VERENGGEGSTLQGRAGDKIKKGERRIFANVRGGFFSQKKVGAKEGGGFERLFRKKERALNQKARKCARREKEDGMGGDHAVMGGGGQNIRKGKLNPPWAHLGGDTYCKRCAAVKSGGASACRIARANNTTDERGRSGDQS